MGDNEIINSQYEAKLSLWSDTHDNIQQLAVHIYLNKKKKKDCELPVNTKMLPYW